MTEPFAVDSSVIVAILKAEPEAAQFTAAINGGTRIVGWGTLFETRIWTIRNDADQRQPWLDGFIRSPLTLAVPFDGALEQMASLAYATFGKGRHPAQLNFGDCMAYAVAQKYDVPLLFKGADFGCTDLKIHPASVVLA